MSGVLVKMVQSTMLILLLKSHLTGSAIPNKRTDHHSITELVLAEAKAQTYMVLERDVTCTALHLTAKTN